MSSESILFLLFDGIGMAATLAWLARSRPGNAVRFVAYVLPFGLILMLWGASWASRHPRDNTLFIGHDLLGIPYIVAFYLIDRHLRIREGLVFPRAVMPSFQEVGASGRGCDSPMMRFFYANRCLAVTVTESELWVRPFSFFGILGRIGGLLHRIPLPKIHQMERLAGRNANVRFEYTGDDGWCRCVELKLRNPSAFVDAVREGQFEAVDAKEAISPPQERPPGGEG